MNIILLLLLIFFLIAISVLIVFKFLKIDFKTEANFSKSIEDVLYEKNFLYSKIFPINKNLFLALNKQENKLAVVKNFNPKNPEYYEYDEILTSYIEKIEKKGLSIKIYYFKNAQQNVINIYPVSKKTKALIHDIFKNACIKRIQNKHKNLNNSGIFEACNWECDYVWGYFEKKNIFSYFKTKDDDVVIDINLKREHFTIDTKYNYLEMPLYGLAQHLMIYNNSFLLELFEQIISCIKSNCDAIVQNSIYFDYDNNVVYLTNGVTSVQSVVLDRIDEVAYRDSRISFKTKNSDKTINFMSFPEQVKEFENFLINYNLKKIALNFDYKSDKLINVTQNTKFIIDFSRDRLVYCANLNKLSSFSYISIAFESLYSISVEKTGVKHFVRIQTKDKETIDITCDKKEIAQYIEAQILKLAN